MNKFPRKTISFQEDQEQHFFRWIGPWRGAMHGANGAIHGSFHGPKKSRGNAPNMSSGLNPTNYSSPGQGPPTHAKQKNKSFIRGKTRGKKANLVNFPVNFGDQNGLWSVDVSKHFLSK